MSIESVSFIFGSLLILTGLVGGGFQAKEIQIPKIGAAVRAVCALVGCFFIATGIILAPGGTRSDPAAAVALAATLPTGHVNFRIYNQLGSGEVSEQVRVIVDGQSMGTLTVDQIHPNADLLVSVPREGRYSYQVSATAIMVDDEGKTAAYNGTGEGYVNVRSGLDFTLEGDITGMTWLARLVEGK